MALIEMSFQYILRFDTLDTLSKTLALCCGDPFRGEVLAIILRLRPLSSLKASLR